MRIILVTLLCLSGCGVGTAVGIYDRTMDADNVIYNYEYFHDAFNNITAKQNDIRGHVTLLAETEDSAEQSRLRMELSAMRMSCRKLVADYNANSNKANRSIFMGTSLPDNLDLRICE